MTRRRFWTIVLVCLLLPFKAALASGALGCHRAMSADMDATVSGHVHHVGATVSGHAHHADATAAFDAEADAFAGVAAADGGVQAPDPAGEPVAAACLACAAHCAAPALPASSAGAATLVTRGEEPPVASRDRPPGYVCAGLERPPRSI